MDDKRYAVVTFDNGMANETTSEVPAIWLEDGTHCWWPKVKNKSAFIKQRKIPDPDDPDVWALHPIKLEKFYDNYATARTRAQVPSSDDEPKGRGHRKKTIVRHASTDSDDSNTVLSDPPTVAIGSRIISGILENNVIIEEQPTPNEYEIYQLLLDKIEKIEKIEENLNEKFNRLLGITATTNQQLAEIYNILEKRENYSSMDLPVKSSIVQLPLNNLQAVQELEEILKDENNKKDLYMMLSKVGGDNIKDGVLRMLRKCFATHVAYKLSWCGRNQNIKISNHAIIATIREIACSTYVGYNEKDFDSIASEWFRQSKQRQKRESVRPS